MLLQHLRYGQRRLHEDSLPFGKDTAYRFLNSCHTNWRKFTLLLAARIINDFAKTNDKLEIVGGAMGGQILDADGVKALASLPSLDELRAKLVGLIVAPATKLATITQAPAAQIARVLSAYAEKEAA